MCAPLSAHRKKRRKKSNQNINQTLSRSLFSFLILTSIYGNMFCARFYLWLRSDCVAACRENKIDCWRRQQCEQSCLCIRILRIKSLRAVINDRFELYAQVCLCLWDPNHDIIYLQTNRININLWFFWLDSIYCVHKRSQKRAISRIWIDWQMKKEKKKKIMKSQIWRAS